MIGITAIAYFMQIKKKKNHISKVYFKYKLKKEKKGKLLETAINLWKRATLLKTKEATENAFVYMIIEKISPWWNL